ncbi:hypothetical protein CCACVL1_14187 [Corchorus capsularis]|uniref:Uncharacterized protein n=1 Tax=Corchorus capsularis TaxID=210143 RepID=A0A1R3I7W2_COCAP|nr:hypothetical protein CCACVL1_14187 [Corchorus capsularis]
MAHNTIQKKQSKIVCECEPQAKSRVGTARLGSVIGVSQLVLPWLRRLISPYYYSCYRHGVHNSSADCYRKMATVLPGQLLQTPPNRAETQV